MKKLFKILFILVFVLGFTGSAFAGVLNNYYAYRVTNHNDEDVNDILIEFMVNNDINAKAFKDIPKAYFYTKSDKEHFYVKIYPANKDTDIFVVSDTNFNKDNNPMIQSFKRLSYSYKKLDDRRAYNEYKNDFILYARRGLFDGLAVLPDCLKPIKKGVTKATEKLNKKESKKVALPYKNETGEIKLTCVDTEAEQFNDHMIMLTRKEYRLKYKENKYAHAYEYILLNKADTPLKINKVTGGSIASIVDIEAMALLDFDKIDVMSWCGTFPPLIFLKIPAWTRNFLVAKETACYAKSLPANYTVPAKSSIRMVIMEYKDNKQPLKFSFTRGEENFVIEF